MNSAQKEHSADTTRCPMMTPLETVPEHLQVLCEEVEYNCENLDQCVLLAELLIKYQEVFSKFNDGVGCTTLVEHSIPLVEGARPVRQPPHRLGPTKEAEAERQVNKLLDKGLIEPGSGAWSSPVVMV